MATATMATAAGAAMILYVLSRRLLAAKEGGGEEDRNGDFSKSSRSGRRRIARRPAQAPATWFEAITTLTETLRFTYSETLGKWPIGDLAFGINYLMRRQYHSRNSSSLIVRVRGTSHYKGKVRGRLLPMHYALCSLSGCMCSSDFFYFKLVDKLLQPRDVDGNLQVASVYAGSSSVQLKGPEITAELTYLLRLLTFCMLFSKKPFPVFLESAGYSEEDVLLQEPKAGLLKPAFTILCDRASKCFLLLIRGTHSIKDTLTAATGAVVPFHHSVLHEGGISNLVLGYAHCGMVAAARWIAKCSTPCLLNALGENPDYKVKIIGHSLGGGTAALLTYILRERKEFSSTTCVTFAPAACMTWDLAESGKHFITTVINGSDLVPTFSTASIDDLRTEVTASSWLNDLRDQVEHTRILNVFYRSASALGSRLPSIASARARVVGAGTILRPVSSSTQVVMKRAQSVAEAVVRTRSSLSSWSCMGARRRAVGPLSDSKEDTDEPEASLLSNRTSDSFVTEEVIRSQEKDEVHCACPRVGSARDESEEEEEIIQVERVGTSAAEDVTEGELWYELEKELHRQENEEVDIKVREEEEVAAKEITEEENVLADTVEHQIPSTSSDVTETQRFYPPGRIMHIVSILPTDNNDPCDESAPEEHVGIYETPRDLYSKLRLSRTMINDHYMPMYKKMMELLISKLQKDEEDVTVL